MHTLLFLDPGHFHAALTLREPRPRVSPEIFVYAPGGAAGQGPELRDFLALVARFNGRAERPTRWRPVVIADSDPLARLIEQRRGDVVVLAGRNGGKARTFRGFTRRDSTCSPTSRGWSSPRIWPTCGRAWRSGRS
jgi:hypothetical protein